MNELEIIRMELDDHIGALEIAKTKGYMTEYEKRLLRLMYRIKYILDRVEE